MRRFESAWRRPISLALTFLIMIVPLSTSAGADPVSDDAPDDEVPENWILTDTRVQGETMTIGDRWRVLPGARLTIEGSTLTFTDHPSGPTGIIAEPGSIVRVVDSALRASTPGSFLLHLTGETHIERTNVEQAAGFIVSPRPITDFAEPTAGGPAEGGVPGWRTVRQTATPTAHVVGSTVTASIGPGIVLAAPQGSESSVPLGAPSIVVSGTTVRTTNGPAIGCHTTRLAQDLDSGLQSPAARNGLSWLRISDSSLHSDTGPTVHCASSPSNGNAPERNPPDPIAPAAELLPSPPSLVLNPGVTRAELIGGMLTGNGTAVRIDTMGTWSLTGTTLAGHSRGALVAEPDAALTLASVHADALHDGVVHEAGTLQIVGGSWSGDGTGMDIGNGIAQATLSSTRLEGFHTCVHGGGSFALRGSTLSACGTGVLLDTVQGAVVRDNRFSDNLDPLAVETADPQNDTLSYDHDVLGNTVNGLPLLYLYDQGGFATDTRVGHALVAHSPGVHISKLDLTHGDLHATASPGLVVGAPTDVQGTLLDRVAPTLRPAFEAVFEGVDYAMYPGALKGPEGTIGQGEGNALDQAWTLADLLRREGITVRFVDGRIVMPAEAYMNWTGFDDLVASINVYGFSGSATWTTVTLDHTWIEVEVEPGVWVALDPSFEQYDRREPLDWRTLTDLGSHRFYDPIMANTTVGDDWVQDIPYGQLESEIVTNQQRLVDELRDQNLTAMDLFGGRSHAPTPADLEPQRQATLRFSEVPVERMWSVHIRTQDPFTTTQGELDAELATPILFGRQLTIRGTPSTPDDRQRILDAGKLTDADRTTVEYTTGLWIDGELADIDGKWLLSDGSYEVRGTRSVHRNPGDPLTLAMDLRAPGAQVLTTKTSPLRVGGIYSVVFDIGRTPSELAATEAAVLNASAQAWNDGITQDVFDLEAQIHRLGGVAYFRSVDSFQALSARTHGVIDQPLLSVAVTGQSIVPAYNGTTPVVRHVAPFIDVQRIINSYPTDGDKTRLGPHNAAVGAFSSQMEDQIFAELHNLPAISTIKVLNVANAAGQKIYQIDADNVQEVLPLLDLPIYVLGRIQSAAYSGRLVIVPETEVTYHDWHGAGWIEMDPQTGHAGWLIYGGITLGSVVQDPILLEGGSGAVMEAMPEAELETWEGFAYDDRQEVLGFTEAAWGYYGLASSPVEHLYKTGNDLHFVQDPKNPSKFVRVIKVTDDSTAVTRLTVTSAGTAGDLVRKTGTVALWAGVAFETGVDAHDIYTNPEDTRPAAEKHTEFAVSTAYNVGVAGAAWGGAKVGGATFGILCTAASPAGTVVCGGIGAIGGAIGGGLLASHYKDDVVSFFTD